MKKINDFYKDNKYGLYRNLYEILHPTISKKNISNYKIILDNNLEGVYIFYPKKISTIKSIIIYIHGNSHITDNKESYSSICQEISSNTNKLLIAIDYRYGDNFKYPTPVDDCYKIIKYIYKNIEKYDINPNNIYIMGDSFGATIALQVSLKAIKEKSFSIKKQVLFYPILSKNILNNDITNIFIDKSINLYKNNYYIDSTKDIFNNSFKDMPSSLILCGNADPYLNDSIEYYNLTDKRSNKLIKYDFCTHGFINSSDKEIKDSIYENLNKFMKN